MSFLSRTTSRIADAAGNFLGRINAAAARELAERPTGRLDHTWSARSSATSRQYEAAIETRANADWRAGLATATASILEGLDTMLARSRWLVRNDGYAASAQGGFRRRVVGGGITARAAARDPDTGEQLRGFNEACDALWNAWAFEPRACDLEQTKCLAEKEAVWMDELFAAGGVILHGVYTPRADNVGLAIQELEYEQLDATLTQYAGRAVWRGIETNMFGAPVAYHVYAAAHPQEETPSAAVRLMADTCWHVFRKGRVRQRLGAPWMAAVMPALRNLAMYELYTIAQARTQAAYHGFVEEPASSSLPTLDVIKRLSGKTPEGESDDENHLQVRVENGLFPVLRGGRKVTFPSPAVPNSIYDAFVATNLKRISAGTGLDLPTVARWYAEGNFSTQRMAALEMEAETETVQDLLFINGALRGIRQTWMEIAVREGKLAAPGFRESARWRAAYLATNWQGPPKRSHDRIKDAAAWKMLLGMGLATPQDFCNEQGVDLRDVYSQIAEAVALAEEYGIAELLDVWSGGGDHEPKKPPRAGTREPTPPTPPAKRAGGNGSGKAALADLIAERAIMAAVTGEDER